MQEGDRERSRGTERGAGRGVSLYVTVCTQVPASTQKLLYWVKDLIYRTEPPVTQTSTS